MKFNKTIKVAISILFKTKNCLNGKEKLRSQKIRLTKIFQQFFTKYKYLGINIDYGFLMGKCVL
jgi:hypothetical protein